MPNYVLGYYITTLIFSSPYHTPLLLAASALSRTSKHPNLKLNCRSEYIKISSLTI